MPQSPAIGVAPETGPPRFILGVQVFNPSHGLGVGDLSEVVLGGRKIGMPQDHFADNLDGNAGSGGVGGGISAEIVWPERNTDHFPGFRHYHPGRLIGNRKNPDISCLAAVGGIFPEPVSDLLGNEDHLTLPAAFGLSQIQLPVLEVIGGELQHLSDTHAPFGHQFQDQPVSDFGRTKNDLVNGILFDDVPVGGDLRTEQFAQHR